MYVNMQHAQPQQLTISSTATGEYTEKLHNTAAKNYAVIINNDEEVIAFTVSSYSAALREVHDYLTSVTCLHCNEEIMCEEYAEETACTCAKPNINAAIEEAITYTYADGDSTRAINIVHIPSKKQLAGNSAIIFA